MVVRRRGRSESARRRPTARLTGRRSPRRCPRRPRLDRCRHRHCHHRRHHHRRRRRRRRYPRHRRCQVPPPSPPAPCQKPPPRAPQRAPPSCAPWPPPPPPARCSHCQPARPRAPWPGGPLARWAAAADGRPHSAGARRLPWPCPCAGHPPSSGSDASCRCRTPHPTTARSPRPWCRPTRAPSEHWSQNGRLGTAAAAATAQTRC
mmetsp:Transcript_1892/g.6244  ORF Transcript_1892/g.6244 Transcript_1892/m.6244 type:complete len:205 (-) Transcript_1892:787-1401(-)